MEFIDLPFSRNHLILIVETCLRRREGLTGEEKQRREKELSFFLRGHAYYLSITIFVPNINQSRLGCVAVTPVSISRFVGFKADIVNSFSSQNLHTFPAITHSTSFKSTTTLPVPFQKPWFSLAQKETIMLALAQTFPQKWHVTYNHNLLTKIDFVFYPTAKQP